LVFAFIFLFLLVFAACKTFKFRANYNNANSLLHETKNIETKPFLKAHLKNGDVCVLQDSWQVDTVRNILNCKGNRFNFNRKEIYSGTLALPLDSVAIFETN